MKYLFLKSISVVLLLSIASTSANAACRCVCENNQKTWVCANSWDIPMGFCGGPCFGYNKPEAEDLSSNRSAKTETTVCALNDIKILSTKK